MVGSTNTRRVEQEKVEEVAGNWRQVDLNFAGCSLSDFSVHDVAGHVPGTFSHTTLCRNKLFEHFFLLLIESSTIYNIIGVSKDLITITHHTRGPKPGESVTQRCCTSGDPSHRPMTYNFPQPTLKISGNIVDTYLSVV